MQTLLLRCPYCLQEASNFGQTSQTKAPTCPHCSTIVPRAFLENDDLIRTMVGVVGFSGHGKTVFLTSLFSTLKRFSSFWNGYYFRSLDDFTHRIIYEQVPRFEKGDLPESTPANFPNPALVYYHKLPGFRNAFVGYYDTAGEVFNEVTQIARAGFFVAHADTVLFIVSIPDCGDEDLDDAMSRLLDTYIRAANDRLGTHTAQKQRLVVIFSKSDMMQPRLTDELQAWLKKGTAESYARGMEDHLLDLPMISVKVEEWLRTDLGCTRFPNMARDNFREVRYTIVSATGLAEDGNPQGMVPLRILDPFLWIIEFSRRDSQTISIVRPSLWQRIASILRLRKEQKPEHQLPRITSASS